MHKSVPEIVEMQSLELPVSYFKFIIELTIPNEIIKTAIIRKIRIAK